MRAATRRRSELRLDSIVARCARCCGASVERPGGARPSFVDATMVALEIGLRGTGADGGAAEAEARVGDEAGVAASVRRRAPNLSRLGLACDADTTACVVALLATTGPVADLGSGLGLSVRATGLAAALSGVAAPAPALREERNAATLD